MNGEREALKGLGLAINEADMKAFAETQGLVWENLDKSSKAMLTFEAITARSTNVIGDFARSSDSFANQSRVLKGRLDDLKVAIGDELLPVATSAISTFSGMVAAFNGLTPETKSLVFELGGLAVALTTAAKVAPSLITGVSNMSGFLRGLPALVNPASAAVVGIGLVLYGFAKALRASADEYTNLREEISQESLSKMSRNEIANAVKQDQKTIDNIQKSIEDYRGLLRKTRIDGKLQYAAPESERKNAVKEITALEQQYQTVLNNREKLATRLAELDGPKKKGGASDLEKEKAALLALQKTYVSSATTAEKAAKDTDKAWNDLSFDEKLNVVASTVSEFGQALSGLVGSIGNLFAAQDAAEIEALERSRQRALEAAGVAEDTAVEKAAAELEIAKEKGDAAVIQEKEEALTRAKINEEFDKKKAKLEYEASLRAWEIQRAQAAISLVLAPLQAYTAAVGIPMVGPFIAPVLAAAAAITAGIGYASVLAAKPSAPKFAEGGIVPGSQMSGDKVTSQLNSGEMVLTREQQAELFNVANGAGAGGQPIHLTVQIGAEKLYDMLFNASKSGELLISNGAVVAR